MTDSERTKIEGLIEKYNSILKNMQTWESKDPLDVILIHSPLKNTIAEWISDLRSLLDTNQGTNSTPVEPACAKNAHTELEEALKIMEESAKFLEDFGDVKKYYKPEKCEHNFVTYKGSLSGPKYCFKCKQWEEPTSQFPLKQTDYFPPIDERYATSNPYNGIKILEHQLRETNKKLDNMTAYLRERHT